ncbi:MAG TPA: NfeD family protein [Burkholderiaceae bacterium]|nr:NfeD family protein [Burkholderiaceae bacterium]
MEEHWLWYIGALAMLIAELFTGTFYMLVIAVALAAGGTAALFGGSFALHLVVAAAVGFVGVLVLRRSRFGKPQVNAPEADANVNIDIGNQIVVDSWDALRQARVMYRGAMWTVQLQPGEPVAPGPHVIAAVRGNTLVVSAAR